MEVAARFFVPWIRTRFGRGPSHSSGVSQRVAGTRRTPYASNVNISGNCEEGCTMMHHRSARTRVQIVRACAIVTAIVASAAGMLGWYAQFEGSRGGRVSTPGPGSPSRVNESSPAGGRRLAFRPFEPMDTSGYQVILAALERWRPGDSLEKLSELWKEPGHKLIAKLEGTLESARRAGDHRKIAAMLMTKSLLFNYEGEPDRSYEVLLEARSVVERADRVAREFLFTIIYFQGVAALRRGENENCIMCRGESSCILPIAPAAVHTNPDGSRLAIRHFTEYLERFPDDLEVRWLLNLAHMTLGEYPDKVDPRFLVSLDRFPKLRIRHRQVPRRRPPGRRQSLQPGRRRDHGGFRQRRPARHRRHLL